MELGAKGLSVISAHFAPDRAYGGIAAAAEAGIEVFHAS
jgi:phosphoribosylcarboxyaminoimidazole (NCAIR) mutase